MNWFLYTIMAIYFLVGMQTGVMYANYLQKPKPAVYEFLQFPIDATHTYADDRNACPGCEFHCYVQNPQGVTTGMILTRRK